MDNKTYEQIIYTETYRVIQDFLKNSTQILPSEKAEILEPLKTLIVADGDNLSPVYTHVIQTLKSELQSLKQTLVNLPISHDVQDSIRRQVKKMEFLNLAVYLLTKVRHHLLLTKDLLPSQTYQLITHDYLKWHQPLIENLPGISTGFKDDLVGHSLFLYAGHINSDEDSPKIDENTRFDIASITKMFLALEILKLHEAGLYDIYKPLSSYLDGRYNFDIDIESLAKFKYEIVTDGRIDYNLPLAEIERRLKEARINKCNTHVYSDIPYILIGETLKHPQESFSSIFQKELELNNTSYHHQGVLTGGSYGHLDLIHDPKARVLSEYGLTPGHAGLYSTSEDLIKLFEGLEAGFLSENSFHTLITQNYPAPILYNEAGVPVIKEYKGHLKYQNVNRAMGVYIPHPYGLRYTEVPDVASDKTFGASGFTGCYTVYDLPNGISANICTNPYSSQIKGSNLALTENDLKVAQFHYAAALRLMKYTLEQVYLNTQKESRYQALQKVLTKPHIIKN